MSVLLRTLVAAHLLLAGGASRLRTAISSTGIAFDYSKHGQDWVQGTCASRARQSPIDFPDRLKLVPAQGKLFYSYQRVATSFEMSNNGHTFSIDLGGMGFGGITYDNAWYNLLNVNVHAISEHTFEGKHSPIEIHLVHKKYDSDALLIAAIPVTSEKPPPTLLQLNKTVTDKRSRAQQEHRVNAARQPSQGVLLGSPNVPPPSPAPGAPIAPPYAPPSEDDPNFNKQIQAFLKTNPPPVNMRAEVTMLASDPLDLNQLYEGGTFYEYPGSTTAPPCAEVAVWMVRAEPIMASDMQVAYLHDGIFTMTADFGNFREVMPLNGRTVLKRDAIYEEPPPPRPDTKLPVGPSPHTDREYRAMKWAKDALKIAKESVDYVKDLDLRLRNAAQAHSDALAPELPTLPPPPGLTTPPPSAHGVDPFALEKTAQAMSQTIQNAAKEAITSATAQLRYEAQNAAMEAAKDASRVATKGIMFSQH